MTIIEKNMKNIAIINGINESSYANKPLVAEKTAINLVCQFSRTLPEIEKTLILSASQKEIEKGIETIDRPEWNTEELLKTIESLTSGYDNIFYFFIDCPFLDQEITGKMYNNHIKYMADYTFADGYPYGLTPEIMKTDCIKRLISLNKNQKNTITRQSIFDIIKTDINSFDIETELAPKDQRMLRVRLCADSKRDFRLLERVASHGAGDSIAICNLLDQKPEILRTLPGFFSIQIMSGCPQVCRYCPYPQYGKKDGKEITDQTDEMSPAQFKEIVDNIVDFCDDAVISISLWGEPALHSRIPEIVDIVRNYEKLSLLIETSGIGWKPDVLRTLSKIKERPPQWILSLDAWTAPMYESLRGQGFQTAYETAETLLTHCKERVYVQAVRMKENEDDLEHFYLNWQKKTDKIIIQKYDSFCGQLPERKVTDLSPLTRYPCWHVKRDMNVLMNGDVPLCREDIFSGIILGNVFTHSLPEIWEKGQKYYMDHTKEDYPQMCRKCDEYYTFNF